MSESSALRAAAEIIREHTPYIALIDKAVGCEACDWTANRFIEHGPYTAHSLHVAGLVAAALLPEEPPEWWRDAVEEAVHGYNEPARAYQALRASLLGEKNG